jgi:hypothetical protein
MEVKSVSGVYLFERGGLHLENLQAYLLQGHLAGDMEMLNLSGNPSSHLQASLKNVSLEALSNSLPAGNLGRVRMVGSANIDAQVAWSNSLQDLVAHSHAVIDGPPQTNAVGSDIPLHGTVDVKYDAARDTVSFSRIFGAGTPKCYSWGR